MHDNVSYIFLLLLASTQRLTRHPATHFILLILDFYPSSIFVKSGTKKRLLYEFCFCSSSCSLERLVQLLAAYLPSSPAISIIPKVQIRFGTSSVDPRNRIIN